MRTGGCSGRGQGGMWVVSRVSDDSKLKSANAKSTYVHVDVREGAVCLRDSAFLPETIFIRVFGGFVKQEGPPGR